MPLSLRHEELVNQACADGWSRERWHTALNRYLRKAPWLIEADEINAMVYRLGVNPDAWRIVVERPGEPGVSWYWSKKAWYWPMLVLEFLEVEITNVMSADKESTYKSLWTLFDGTDRFRFCAYRMDRFGRVLPVLPAWME